MPPEGSFQLSWDRFYTCLLYTSVELNTNGHHTTYEMKISGFDLDTSTNKVYGVVLTTADGSEYGLHCCFSDKDMPCCSGLTSPRAC